VQTFNLRLRKISHLPLQTSPIREDRLAAGVRRILAGMVPLIPPEQGTPVWDLLLKWRRR
jgi:hypothetical protein